MVVVYLEPGPNNSLSEEDRKKLPVLLTGTTASSVHRLKDEKNQDGAWFIFQDLTVKKEGEFQLRFVLMSLEESRSDDGTFGGGSAWVTVCETRSKPFTVHGARSFPGMAESTFLTRTFSEQGVRLRLRKDSRQLTTRKRNRETAQIASMSEVHRQPHDAEHGQGHDRTVFGSVSYDEPDNKRRRIASTTAHSPYTAHRSSSTAQSPYTTHNSMQHGSIPYSDSYMPVSSQLPPASTFAVAVPMGQAFSPTITTPPMNNREYPPMPSMMGMARPSMSMDTYQGFQQPPPQFVSPQDRQSPGSYQNYPSTQASPSVQHTPTGQQLPPIMPTHYPGQGVSNQFSTSPHAHSQYTTTPVSSTGSSDEGAAYNLANQFPPGYPQGQPGGHYDNGMSRTNGLPTPVTGEMTQESIGQPFNMMFPASGGAYGGGAKAEQSET
jgi:hypothetical protein